MDEVGTLLSGMKFGGGILVGGGGAFGGGGSTIMGGFDLSTTASMVPAEGTRDRLGGSSAIEDITDSMDCLLSATETRDRLKAPPDSLRMLESGPGDATGIGTGDIADEEDGAEA